MTDSQIYMSAIGFGGGAYGEESSIYSFWEDFAQHYNNLSTHPIIPPNTMSQEILDNSDADTDIVTPLTVDISDDDYDSMPELLDESGLSINASMSMWSYQKNSPFP